MKQNVNPAMVISLIGAVVVLVAVVVFRAITAPSSTPVPAGAAPGKGAPGPRAGGGPTEADLQRMREYNSSHPGAAASRQ